MPSPLPILSFEQWRDYTFLHAADDHMGVGHVRPEVRADRVRRCAALTPVQRAAYMIELFARAAELPGLYTYGQIAGATWSIFFFFGGRGQLADLWHESVHVTDREEGFALLARLFIDCYDPLCTGAESRDQLDHDQRALLEAVFMIGDDNGPLIPWPHLDASHHQHRMHDLRLHLLRTLLFDCASAACQRCALHAIGHSLSPYERPAEARSEQADACRALAVQLRSLLDEHHQRPDLTDAVRAYSRKARTGMVQ
jgi:hypothetical protein